MPTTTLHTRPETETATAEDRGSHTAAPANRTLPTKELVTIWPEPAQSHPDAAAESKTPASRPVIASIRRVVYQLRPAGSRLFRAGRAPMHLDVPAALGATDAELARLNRSLDRGAVADAHRNATLAAQVGTFRLS